MRRLFLTVLAGLIATSAMATVAVRKKASGAFDFLVFNNQVYGDTLYQWMPLTTRSDEDYLNVNGDAAGDLTPTFAIMPRTMLQPDPLPIVVWSRSQGVTQDVFYSMWYRGSGWTIPRLLNIPNEHNDIGVRSFRDGFNRLHVVWWEDAAPAAVWYSKFYAGSWTPPMRLSSDVQDARNPSFVFADWSLYIRFEDWSASPPRPFSFLLEDFD